MNVKGRYKEQIILFSQEVCLTKEGPVVKGKDIGKSRSKFLC